VTLTVPGVSQTTGPVDFDYVWWQARYPTLAAWVDENMGQMYFDLATMYLDNRDSGAGAGQSTPTIFVPGMGMVGFPGCWGRGSPVTDIGQRQTLLGLLTAHIAQLFAPIGGVPSSNLVGRISSAGEGSVNVSVDFPQVAGAEWYMQTKYGAAFWSATARYRMARYYPAPNAAAMNGYNSRFGRF
jgi:Protein of unknown function (DUF4054)